MPVDIEARVIGNTRLSPDYNVLALAAPAIGAAAAPGQFVMVKAAPGHDPLLRRPFSIFETLRGGDGVPLGISLLNKRIGVSTRLLYDARPGQRVRALGGRGHRTISTASARVRVGGRALRARPAPAPRRLRARRARESAVRPGWRTELRRDFAAARAVTRRARTAFGRQPTISIYECRV